MTYHTELPHLVRDTVLNFKSKGFCVGLVPTMGALHEGHLSLVEASLSQCDKTVVSLFVNPTQFGPNEDFDEYPRPYQRDLQLLTDLGVDLVFQPSSESLYSDPLSQATKVIVPHLSDLYCGQSRPGFFDGVCSIVIRLLNIITPDYAFFGEKDFQQLQIIQKMVDDLFISTHIIGCPIIRDANGLALSSRNNYLSSSEKKQASSIYKALCLAKEEFKNEKHTVSSLLELINAEISKQPSIMIDYLSIIDSTTLSPRDDIAYKNDRILFAGYLSETRLIDNISL